MQQERQWALARLQVRVAQLAEMLVARLAKRLEQQWVAQLAKSQLQAALVHDEESNTNYVQQLTVLSHKFNLLQLTKLSLIWYIPVDRIFYSCKAGALGTSNESKLWQRRLAK